MGIVGRFIDEAAAREPDLMQRVLERPFGDLTYWIRFDEEGEACGCLVGSVALEAGFVAECDDETYCVNEEDAVEVVEDRLGVTWHLAYEAGVRVCRIVRRLSGIRGPWYSLTEPTEPTPEAHAHTVAMLKARIARRLAERTARAEVAS